LIPNRKSKVMKNFSVEIKWGILFSLLSMVWVIGEFVVGLHDIHIAKQPIYTNLFAFVAISIYALALRDKKVNYFKGEMSWQQGFLCGLVLSAVVALLSPIVQYVSYTFISPRFFANIIDYSVKNKVQTLAEAEAYFNMRTYIIQGISGSLSMGVISSSIIAYLLKTKTKK